MVSQHMVYTTPLRETKKRQILPSLETTSMTITESHSCELTSDVEKNSRAYQENVQLKKHRSDTTLAREALVVVRKKAASLGLNLHTPGLISSERKAALQIRIDAFYKIAVDEQNINNKPKW